METLRRLTKEDTPELRELWESCFHDSSSFLDWFFGERYRPATSLCLTAGGQIAAVAYGCPMELRVRQKTVPAMMVSGVSTRPDRRKRGYMHRLMLGLCAIAREAHIPLLFNTPAEPNTYASLGYVSTSDALYWTAPLDAPRLEPTWDPRPPLSDIMNCYAAAMVPYSGVVLRNQAAMTLRLADYHADGGRWLTHWTAGRLTGYLIAQRLEEGWYAPEVAAVDETVYSALLARLPAASKAKLPPDLSFPGQRRPQSVAAAADVPALLSALCQDPRLTFAVSDPIQPANCGVFDGTGAPCSRKADYTLSAGELVQLLFGYGPGDERFPPQSCYCIDEY